jgi:hypothetical protein
MNKEKFTRAKELTEAIEIAEKAQNCFGKDNLANDYNELVKLCDFAVITDKETRTQILDIIETKRLSWEKEFNDL